MVRITEGTRIRELVSGEPGAAFILADLLGYTQVARPGFSEQTLAETASAAGRTPGRFVEDIQAQLDRSHAERSWWALGPMRS